MLSKKNEFLWDKTQKEVLLNWKNVTTDASSYGIAVILSQEQENGEIYVVAYASRTHTPTERK